MHRGRAFTLGAAIVAAGCATSEPEGKLTSAKTKEIEALFEGTRTFDSYDSATAAKRFQQGSLPLLLEILDSHEYFQYWDDAVPACQHIEKNKKLSDALIAFATRDEPELRASGDFERYDVPFNKCVAISALGRTGGKRADEFLRAAVTENGAERLCAAWLQPLKEAGNWEDASNSREAVTVQIQKYAAYGIALSQDKQSLELVEQRYLELHERVRQYIGPRLKVGEEQREMAVDEWLVFNAYDGFAAAMDKADWIEKFDSVAEFLEMLSKNSGFPKAGGYPRLENKHRIPWNKHQLSEIGTKAF